ncbi:MAG: bifunctional serine/threonine-protein kinase/formylglycine-generating enzyme family protein [Anaerolineae bacterium]|nr:bifunctional serine/threonine-protein kinase/formylglycine-generating enzyme family protein [Anaerolineae bacterium]
MRLSSGQTLQGRYRIVRLLGEGGMAAVYLAEDTRLGRRCAVKEHVPEPTASAQALAQMRGQFQVEARTLAGLDHPNLPKVYDCFSDGGNEYIVMEYVEGENLATLLQRQGGPLPERPVLLWADQVLDALEELHGQRPRPIIHRDIKPANVILTVKGRIKLVDFGLVKLLDPSDPRTATSMKGMGTLGYAPLEQYGSGAGHTDSRSDIYSLGATLYHLLTNAAPPEVTQRILDPAKLAPPRQHNATLSPATEAAVLKAIEIHPDQRWQTAAEIRQALAAARLPVTSVSAVPTVPKPQPPPVTIRPTIATPAPVAAPFVGSPIAFDWVTIPAGEFLMGSDTKRDGNAYGDEQPQHRVYLAEYQMARVPVTNAQYKVFVDATGHGAPRHWPGGKIPAGKKDHPVVYVSWHDAQAFCRWAGVRLPTEAEWEKAARGTDGRRYPWGDSAPDCSKAQYSGCGRTTVAVGSKPAGASPYGVLDMAGNVWEWCQDWYGSGYYASSPQRNPQGPGPGVSRVVRGGSWDFDEWRVRAANRGRLDPVFRDFDVGFRCVYPAL